MVVWVGLIKTQNLVEDLNLNGLLAEYETKKTAVLHDWCGGEEFHIVQDVYRKWSI